jgi:vancomycin resistance protein VanW
VTGKLYYRLRRKLQWSLGASRFARRKQSMPLPVVCASHRTPLIRNIAQMDMWMQVNKRTNLRLAADKLDGIIIMPGETFSFWKAVGEPTAGKGYLPGLVLSGGTLKPGVGGGLCQLTNLIYWMTLHTPLTVTERHRHSYDVFPDTDRTQPFGSGATCSYSSLDLQIVNGTAYPYQLALALTADELVGSWRSIAHSGLRYEVYEQEPAILCNPWGGYIRHNVLRRKVVGSDGALIADEFIAENNALMLYQPLLESEVAVTSRGNAAQGVEHEALSSIYSA